MDDKFKRCLDFLKTLGLETIPHTRHTYIGHLTAVFRDLKNWGCEDVCYAGLFHSIYGTELFQGFTLPVSRRGEVRDLIGARAEFLAYVNCAMDRASADRWLETRGPYVIDDRISGGEITMTEADYEDLCRVHLCDHVEQVERSDRRDYRREAYRAMARRLGGVAQAAYKEVARRVFAEEG